MRNFVTLGEAKEAVRKCLAASWSMAIVRAGPPLPPAPGFLLVELSIGIYHCLFLGRKSGMDCVVIRLCVMRVYVKIEVEVEGGTWAYRPTRLRSQA